MSDRNATVVLMGAEAGSVVISPRHQDRLAEYVRRHRDIGLTEEMVVERSLDDFFEKDLDSLRGDSTVLNTLRQYKYL